MPTRTRILPIPMGVGPSPSEFYTKAEIDAMLANYAQLATTDLVNYYLKSETYTQAEIEALVGQITSFEVVSTLPVSDIKTNVIYLLGPIGTGADRYEEYIYSNNDWKKIGETSVDLSNYVTITQLNTALGFYTTTVQLNTLLAGKQDTLTAGDRISISTQNVISADSQIVSLTQQEYDALGTNVDPDVVYVITDASPVVLATVATTGDYDDLINKPTIPVVPTLATVATSGSYNDLSGTPTLATVATTGDYDDLTNKPVIPVVPTLATVATSGSYNDLTDKPVIPVVPTLATVATTGAYADLTGTPTLATVATTGDYSDLSNTPTLATVATSGSYNDLTDKPSISTVNDATITIQQDGVTVGTFTTNEANDKTIALTGGGGGGTNEWYGTMAQFNALGTAADPDTDYYISDPIQYSEISGTPDLSSYATKTDKSELEAEIAGKENSIVFVGTAGLPSIGTPLEGTVYAIEGETLPLTFTLANLSTVTYNFVTD